MSWSPNTYTKNLIRETIQGLLGRLPILLGIDEVITGCELIALDPFGVGAATVPRYVTVSIREYYQQVWYNGVIGLTVGDRYAVIHTKDGDRYEIAGPSGTGGSHGGGWVFPPQVDDALRLIWLGW